jgi:MFS family permease
MSGIFIKFTMTLLLALLVIFDQTSAVSGIISILIPIFIGIGFGVFFPSMLSLTLEVVPPKYFSKDVAVFLITILFTQFYAPLSSTYILLFFRIYTTVKVGYTFIFSICCLLYFLSFVIIFFVFGIHRPKWERKVFFCFKEDADFLEKEMEYRKAIHVEDEEVDEGEYESNIIQELDEMIKNK